MEIIVDIHEGEDGRPEGTVRAAGSSDARSFSGNLEFLALVEGLYRADGRSTTLQPPTRGTDHVACTQRQAPLVGHSAHGSPSDPEAQAKAQG
jgi:hypothetical protein